MSINGINGITPRLPEFPATDAARPGGTRAPDAERHERAGVQGPGTSAGIDAGTEVRGAAGTVPAEPPPGTDPQLWSVLTAQERSYFARARAMGPLTYGPGNRSGSAGAPPTGGRLDIRI